LNFAHVGGIQILNFAYIRFSHTIVVLGPMFGKSLNENNVQIFGRISAILFVIYYL